jgi:TolA-binding protein
MGQCYEKMGEPGKALEEYREIVRDFKNTEWADDAYYWMGEILYEKKEYDSAIKLYRQAIKNFPKSQLLANYHYNLGWAYLDSGDYDKAVSEFREVTRISRDEGLVVGSLCRVGEIYKRLKRYRKAI